MRPNFTSHELMEKMHAINSLDYHFPNTKRKVMYVCTVFLGDRGVITKELVDFYYDRQHITISYSKLDGDKVHNLNCHFKGKDCKVKWATYLILHSNPETIIMGINDSAAYVPPLC